MHTFKPAQLLTLNKHNVMEKQETKVHLDIVMGNAALHASILLMQTLTSRIYVPLGAKLNANFEQPI